MAHMKETEFEDRINAILSADTLKGLRRVALRVFRQMGIKRIAYVYSVSGHPDSFYIDQIGFPKSIETGYFRSTHHLDDPFPRIARKMAFPVLWSRYNELNNLSKRHKTYIKSMRAAEIGDGLSVSAFGPNGRDGYFALGYGHYDVSISDRELAHMQLICQTVHNVLCELTHHLDEETLDLSHREAQVLFWLVRGKSNSVTASILGVSPHTVDTLCKRVFKKLGVHDRVSAAIVGLRTATIPHNASGNV